MVPHFSNFKKYAIDEVMFDRICYSIGKHYSSDHEILCFSTQPILQLVRSMGCHPIEHAVRSSDILLRTTSEVPNRSVKPADRTDRSIDRPERVRTLQCPQMLQRKLQKFKPSYTNTSEEETIHSDGPADRASRPIEQATRTVRPTERIGLFDRTYCSNDQTVRPIYTCLHSRVTHYCAIELFRLTLLSALPSIHNQSL
ncbi:hypothetical protein HanIR_Chr08g0358441 [Helianthus annuus]|nr:hypothetical protein HanIR_Chr08g0358441 [Helianthus annuus]